ncbi:Sulfide dehydrogenase [flavocytochrome c] flavoprotein chain [bacterium HR40]|nr:Sulfide dehydrogenase [flavocytochrome c] flavoprotein chain [bacterium HR40]
MSLTTTRRQLLRTAAVVAPVWVAAPGVLRAQAKPRVVVVGGGPAGTTVAKYVARDSEGKVAVALVEPKESYTTCFYGNLYLGGQRTFDSITHNYVELVRKYGVAHYRDTAVAVDPATKKVRLASGRELAYDRLVVAPGIDIRYDSIDGYSEEAAAVMPHAWQAGEQTALLKAQLEAMEDGGLFILASPPNPYRCPPGPYERASMIAWYFKQHKPKSKILILDAKKQFSKQDLFLEGWNRHYPGMIEWVPEELGGTVEAVDPATMTVVAGGEKHKAAVANIVPAQRAGFIARAAGLANDSGWCPVEPGTFKSKLQPDIFVLGDAAIAADMPKSAFSANSQAKVVAMVIRHELTGSKLFEPRLRNTCWSSITDKDTVKIGANYRPTEAKLEAFDSFVSKVGESDELRAQTRAEADAWYDSIVQDIFA